MIEIVLGIILLILVIIIAIMLVIANSWKNFIEWLNKRK